MKIGLRRKTHFADQNCVLVLLGLLLGLSESDHTHLLEMMSDFLYSSLSVMLSRHPQLLEMLSDY